jgi:hypothetical protein
MAKTHRDASGTVPDTLRADRTRFSSKASSAEDDSFIIRQVIV